MIQYHASMIYPLFGVFFQGACMKMYNALCTSKPALASQFCAAFNVVLCGFVSVHVCGVHKGKPCMIYGCTNVACLVLLVAPLAHLHHIWEHMRHANHGQHYQNHHYVISNINLQHVRMNNISIIACKCCGVYNYCVLFLLTRTNI